MIYHFMVVLPVSYTHLRLVLVQVMVGVTYIDVERRTASLAFGQIQRVEYRCGPANGGEVAYLPVIVHKGAVAVVSLQAGRIRTGPVSYTHLDVYKRQMWRTSSAWASTTSLSMSRTGSRT